MSKAQPARSVIATLAAMFLLASHPVQAEPKCASESVSARGEPSRFLWLAKNKARGNWRAKVRAMPELGPDYANWSRATATEERCLSGPEGSVCILTATPCRP